MARLFQKGASGNPNGRPKGSRNKASLEIRAMAQQIIESPAYLKGLEKRLLEGKAPHMEPLLFYYAYGKPVERIAPTDPTGENPYESPLVGLTLEERREFLAYLRRRKTEEE